MDVVSLNMNTNLAVFQGMMVLASFRMAPASLPVEVMSRLLAALISQADVPQMQSAVMA
jgi:hypothetical protein